MDDAEERLHDNLDGLDWLVAAARRQAAGAEAQAAHACAAPPAAAVPSGWLAEGRDEYRTPAVDGRMLGQTQ